MKEFSESSQEHGGTRNEKKPQTILNLHSDVTHDEVVKKFNSTIPNVAKDMKEGGFYFHPHNDKNFKRQIVNKRLEDTVFFCETYTGPLTAQHETGDPVDNNGICINGRYDIDQQQVDVEVGLSLIEQFLFAGIELNAKHLVARQDWPGKTYANFDDEEMRKAGIKVSLFEGLEAKIAPGDSPYPFAIKLLEDFSEAKIDREMTREILEQIRDELGEQGISFRWVKNNALIPKPNSAEDK